MGVLNATPDSFSDGGLYASLELATARAAQMVAEGAQIIDIGGESTRPGAASVSTEEELRRVVPIIEALGRANLGVVLSVDTTKSMVARAAIDAGAEVINDVSGLRFDPRIGEEVARAGAGLVLMHSRGAAPQQMHGLEPVIDIKSEVSATLWRSVTAAERSGVERSAIALDPGFGFGKSQEQNLWLLANLGFMAREFPGFPVLVGTSRKSFIGRTLNGAAVEQRLHGTMATIAAAILQGAHIVRVHDVAATVETARVADAIKKQMSDDVC